MRVGGRVYGKITMRQFSVIDFPTDLEGIKFVGQEKIFSCFSTSLIFFPFPNR